MLTTYTVHFLARSLTRDVIATPLQATLSPSGKFIQLRIGNGVFELLQLPGPPEELDERAREWFIAYTDADVTLISKSMASNAQTLQPILYHFTTRIERIDGLEEVTEGANQVLERAHALRRMTWDTRRGSAALIEMVLPLGTQVKEVLSRTTDQGVYIVHAAYLPTGEEIHYEYPLYVSHARCWVPLSHERVFLGHREVSDTATGGHARTLTERLLALGEEYTILECILRFLKHFPNERQERRTIGAYYACSTITSCLRPSVLVPETPPAKARKVVLSLLRQLKEEWQAGKSMVNNRPRGLLETASWQAEGALALIEEAVADLWPFLSPQLRKAFVDEQQMHAGDTVASLLQEKMRST